jgi:DNA-binding NarL/FixJ family response regulator
VVGRALEQRALTDAVAALQNGAACVELAGEPGIGKTTMLAFLGETAAARGAVVLSGRCSEFDGDVPFGVFVDAVDGHLGETDERWSRDLDDYVRAELAAIFPSLSMPGSAAAGSASVERFRSYRAVRTLLERLAATRPVVLMLDDAHWADRSSLELIGALVRRPPRARVLVALAHRPHQAPQRLLRELASGARVGAVQHVALGALSQTESYQLLANVTRDAERDRLFVECGGNPFYLQQLASSTGDGRAERALELGVPPGVAASMLAELERLSGHARQLARAGSVAGDPFDVDLAAEIAKLDRLTALAGLDELISAGLVQPERETMTFAFRHPLVHRAVYESAQPGWRIAAHARACAALTRSGAPVVTRAHHVARSAPVGDEQAIELLQQAAQLALAPAAAAQWWRAALRLAPAGEGRLWLLCMLGRSLATAGLLEEGRETLVEALQCWRDGRDRDGRVGLVVLCATLERLLGRHAQARARLEAAAREIDDPLSLAGVLLSIELASVRVFSAAYATARDAAQTAVSDAAGLGMPVLHAAAVAVAAFGDFCIGDLDAARSRVEEGTALVGRLEDAELAVRPDVLFTLGWTERCLDHYARAVAHFERGLEIGRLSGHTQLHVEIMVGRASTLLFWGRLTQAQVAFEEALDAARLSENQQTLGWALAFSCFSHMASGSLQRGIEDGEEGVALAVDDSLISTTCWLALGVTLAEAGQWEEGLSVMTERGGGAGLKGMYPLLRPYFYEAMTRAELGLGRVDRAAGWAHRASRLVEGVDCDLPRAQAERAAAAVLLARGDAAAAAERALSAAATADRIEARVDASRSRLLAGRALAVAGRRVDAGETLRVAEAQFAACGARRLREEAVRELRRIGRRVARASSRGDGGTSGIGALSGREREVADLVQARHTNREIAEHLFLSEKTIESHLRNVFIKLNVSSRADVARTLDASG